MTEERVLSSDCYNSTVPQVSMSRSNMKSRSTLKSRSNHKASPTFFSGDVSICFADNIGIGVVQMYYCFLCMCPPPPPTHAHRQHHACVHFPQVVVDQPTVASTISILRGLRPRYEQFHGVDISEGALIQAAQLSAR